MVRSFHPQSNPVSLAICFGICFALMSWLHPAGLIREATSDNLSCHMWCSPLYMHLKWTTKHILSEPPVPTTAWTQAGKLTSKLHFCFVLLTWTQSLWEPPWHSSTAHGHTGHVEPEQTEQEFPHSAMITFHIWIWQEHLGCVLSVSQLLASLSRLTT